MQAISKIFLLFSLTDNLKALLISHSTKNEIEKKIATKSFANPGVQHWRKLLIVLFQVEKIKKFMI